MSKKVRQEDCDSIIKGAEQVKKEVSVTWCWRMEDCLRSVEHLLTLSPDWASVSHYFSFP